MKGTQTIAIEHFIKSAGLDFEKEYKFSQDRKFRFDYAIPLLMLGIEYEGTMSAKSRHTTVTGYSKDCEKYNLAQLEGWKVLRYTALNYTQLQNDLEKLGWFNKK